MPFSNRTVAYLTLFLAWMSACAARKVKGIYLFANVTHSDTHSIKTSGFNTGMIFALDLKSNGDLVYPAIVSGDVETPLVTNGVYVGGNEYVDLIRGYKTGNTTLKRIEVTVGPYRYIRDLINAQGTGPSSSLYRTLAALKAAWNLDAINNDDEVLYDLSATVQFATMVGKIGYKYTTAPYTNVTFWADVTRKVNGITPGLPDRHNLQCYDGGYFNDPEEWQRTLGMKVVPLLWVTNLAKPDNGSTPEQMRSKFTKWHDLYHVAGGGLWNQYDIEQTHTPYSAYASVLNSIFR